MDNEFVRHPSRRLGRRPASGKPALRLGPLLTGAVPAHPAAADNLAKATYGLYGNDRYGDCGPTDVANSRRQVTAYLTGTEADPSQDDVFDLYRRSGNPDFDPDTGEGDNGVDMQTMMEAVHSGGIGGVKSVAFAKVDVGNLDEVRAAIAIFGALHLGVTLDVAQQDQTDEGTWDYVRRSDVWGGHAVLAGRYTSAKSGADISVVTWGEIVGTTDAFWTHQVDEAWVCIWPEHLGAKEFLDGVDLDALAADYKALTGKDLPVSPQPAPTPDDPDAELAGCLPDFIAKAQRWLDNHKGS